MPMTETQLELKRQELEKAIAEAKNDVERKKYELELKKFKDMKPFEKMSKFGQFARGISNLVPGKFKINDPAWYLKLTYIKDLLGKLSFTDPLDDGLQISDLSSSSIVDGYMKTFGICLLHFGPTLGGTDSDAIQTEAVNLWKAIRGTATGDTNGIGASTVIHYVLAFDSILMNLAKASRLLGLNNTTSDNLNRYKPSSIIKSLGFDPEDISAGYSDYVAAYNKIVKRLEVFNIPDGVDYFTRHRWLCSTVMKDRNIRKSQFYIYDCPHSFVWDETNTKLVGHLYYQNGANYTKTDAPDFATWQSQTTVRGMKLSFLFEIIDEQIKALTLSKTMKLVNGEIQRAIDAGRLAKMQLPQISTDSFEFEFICHDEPLMQIKNSRIISFSGNTYASKSTFDISYDVVNDSVVQTGFTQASRSTFGNHDITEFNDYLLDISNDKPTVEDIMVMTRNVPTFKQSGNGVAVDHCGDIFLYHACVLSYLSNSSVNRREDFLSYMLSGDMTLDLMCAINQFDWLPIIFFTDTDTSVSPITFNDFGVFTELNNFCVANKKSLNEFHEAAIFSLMQIDKIEVK